MVFFWVFLSNENVMMIKMTEIVQLYLAKGTEYLNGVSAKMRFWGAFFSHFLSNDFVIMVMKMVLAYYDMVSRG